MNILIDTGASASIMNPDIAFKYFPSLIYQHAFEITACQKTIQGQYAVKIPLLSEFKNNTPIEFLLLPWHNKFDCLLGFKDLVNLQCSIDLKNKCLRMPNIKIYYSEDIFVHNKLASKIKDGEVIVPSITVNENLTLPESICNVNNFKVNYPYDLNNLDIDIIKTEPLENFEVQQKAKTEPVKLNVEKVIRTDHMNSEEKAKIIKLCYKYKQVFYNPEEKLSSCNVTSHHIRTKDDEPIYIKNFRYPYHLKQEIQKQISKLLDNKIIRPSISPYSSPVWIVPKKMDASGEKKWRMVIDFRKLNEKTIEDKYPLPRTEEILENLGKCQYFSTLDLAQGFHQIPLNKESIEKTAFTVENGHYEYTRMPFGLKNAPATFQ